jgi:outer membrane receptor protein involved in Fe transport
VPIIGTRDPVTGAVTPGFAPTAGDGLVNLSIGRRLVEVGPRHVEDERNSWRVVTGLRGDLGDAGDGFLTNLSYDAYYLFSRTLNTERQFGNVSRSGFQQALLRQGGADPVLNIFGEGSISEAAAEAVRINVTNVEVSQLQVASGLISGDLAELPAGPLGFAFGTEWRSVSAEFNPDFALSSGDVVGFNAGQPTAGGYNVWEMFGEFRVPVLADMPFARSLELSAAFRYSDYSLDNVGGVWTYAGGVDWAITDDIALRGQFQRAVRAPNVSELFGGQAQGFPPAQDPCAQASAASDATIRDLCAATGVPAGAIGTDGVQPNSQIQGLFGGNPDLQEETSDTFTVGAVFTPTAVPGLSVTVDYYNMKSTISSRCSADR